LFAKMLKAAKKIIISESVVTLANMGGAIGWIARRAVNSGKGQESFRFNEDNLVAALERQKLKYNYSYNIKKYEKDMIAIIHYEKN